MLTYVAFNGVDRYIESGAVTSYRDAAEDADGTAINVCYCTPLR